MNYKKTFYLLLILTLLILLGSCSITKKADKKKLDTKLTEQIITKTTRIGDTVRYEVPKVILKDTTIYTYNKQGSTLITRYNEKGNVSQIECLTSNIDLLMQENRMLVESLKAKQSEKKEVTKDSFIYAFALGIVIIIIAGFYILSKKIPQI